MSAHDGVSLIAATITDIDKSSFYASTENAKARKLELLAIREAITRDADWSEMQESNLRTHLAAAEARADAAVAEAADEQATHERVETDLRRQLESARRIAVALEQEAAGEPAVEFVFPCSWCDCPSVGLAYQFSDHTYPERSCGEHGHDFLRDEVLS